MMQRPPTARLSISDAREVLRYWRESLRADEALQTRPHARKVEPNAQPPRIDLPTPGQEYFKLTVDADLTALVLASSPVERPLSCEVSAYFETWLHTQYRRSEGDADAPHLLCFPVVQLARGELAGLFRAQVRLAFQNARGDHFRVPSRSERARGRFPEPPVTVTICPLQRVPGALPLFVDTRLLNRTFGVPYEQIDALFETLRARDEPTETDMVDALCALLERDLAPNARAEDSRPIVRLSIAAARRLQRIGGRARAYPVGLIMDGSAAKTTWHLQQELKTLLSDDDALGPGTPLHSYLTHTRSASGSAQQYARFHGPPLTAIQYDVATRFWGSRFSAVQGPPGTGKTTLILHLCAEALVRSAGALADHGAPSDRPFVIASSNNRAVDNVLSPLAELAGNDLPFALRTGSRQVMADELLPTLYHARQLLTHAHAEPHALRLEAMKSALYGFVAVRHRLREALAPEEQRRKREAAREAVREARSQIDGSDVLSDRARRLCEVRARALHALSAAITPVEGRLEALTELCTGTADEPRVQRVHAHFRRTQKRSAAVLAGALTAAATECDLLLPPPHTPGERPQPQLARWEHALEHALDALSALRADVSAALAERARAEKLRALDERLCELEREARVPDAPGPTAAHLHDEGLALFHAALAARNAWAHAHAEELVDALDAAIRSLAEERSLRPFFRDETTRARLFLQLFGIWGCTLLSFGNVFPPEATRIGQLVIDEAGQCHPAHAVSGLLRAEQALVIGDVHQLAPVLTLSRDDDARLRYSLRLAIDAARIAPFLVHDQADSSAQSVADLAAPERLALIDHFRCQNAIIALSDRLCGYGLRVHTPPAQRAELSGILPAPVVFFDIVGAQEELGGSYHNAAELDATLLLLTRILDAGVAASDIALITPYRGQLERLQRACIARAIPLEHSAELREGEHVQRLERRGLALGTVHRFQGGERSVVLFSSVVSEARSLPFLNARPNLLNVAISRARHHFAAIGAHSLLAHGARTRVLTDNALILRQSPRA